MLCFDSVNVCLFVSEGAKPYVCDHCNKRFPTLTNRRRHERIHRGTRLACPLCSSSFTQSNDLKKHVRRQHLESYRACAYCSRYFTADSQLSVHLRRVHPGCDLEANRRRASVQRFAKSAALEADRAESKRLAAEAVDGSVTSPAAMTTTTTFACTVCRKSFSDYANMCRHRRLAHGCGALGADQEQYSSDDDDVASGVVGGRTADSAAAVMDLQQAFFAGVSKNIAANLNHHVAGKVEDLVRASSHIRWKQSASGSAAVNAVAAAVVADQINGASSAVKLEDFNFPHGYKVRPLAELYESNGNGSVSNDAAQLIHVPDVRMCQSCQLVFHSTAALEDHVLQHHDTAATESAAVDHGPPTLTAEQPIDLRSPPVAVTSRPADAIPAGDVIVRCDDDLGINNPDKTLRSDKRSVDLAKKLLCLVCFTEFYDVDSMLHHQSERHANIDCRHIEVDVNYFPSSAVAKPNVIGLLNVSSNQLPTASGTL